MTAALTLPVSDMQAILDGRQWLYLAPQKVRQTYVEVGKVDRRERSVRVVPPAPVTCPECDGEGTIPTGAYAENGEPYFEFCERCGGSGTVPGELLLCAEQCRDIRLDVWGRLLCDDERNCEKSHVRRTAGLVLVPQPTYLPVVDAFDGWPGNDRRPFVCVEPSSVLIYGPPTEEDEAGTITFVTAEPYAPLLEPGGLLVTWDRADILDPPIVEMACLCPSIREGSLRGFTGRMVRRPDLCSACSPETPGRVPLSVGTGFTEVSL